MDDLMNSNLSLAYFSQSAKTVAWGVARGTISELDREMRSKELRES